MAVKKIIVYQKNSPKPIILTDEFNDDIKEIKEKILNIFNDTKIFTLETKNDLLIGRPSDLQAILISSSPEIENNLNGEKTEKNKKYEKGLVLDAKLESN